MAGSWAGRLQHGVPGPLWAPVCGHSGLLLKEARLLFTQWPRFLQAYVSEPSSVTLIETWWQKPQSARWRGLLSALRPPPTSERAAFCSGGISCSSPPHARAGGWVQTCPPLLRTGLCWPSVELKVSSVAAAVMRAAVGLFCCLISVSILDFFVVSTVFILNHGWVADWACSAQGKSDRLLHPIHLNQGTSQHLTVCQPVSPNSRSPLLQQMGWTRGHRIRGRRGV